MNLVIYLQLFTVRTPAGSLIGSGRDQSRTQTCWQVRASSILNIGGQEVGAGSPKRLRKQQIITGISRASELKLAFS